MSGSSDAPGGGGDAAARLMAKLADPQATFTRDQVAWLMGAAGRWGREAVEGEPSDLTYAAGHQDGYRARCAEENAIPRDAVVSVLGRWVDQIDYRRECDAAARLPRDGDFPGKGGAT